MIQNYNTSNIKVFFDDKEIEAINPIPIMDIATTENNPATKYYREVLKQLEITVTLDKKSKDWLSKLLKRSDIAENKLRQFKKHQRILIRTNKHRTRKKQAKIMKGIILNSKELLNFYDIHM